MTPGKTAGQDRSAVWREEAHILIAWRSAGNLAGACRMCVGAFQRLVRSCCRVCATYCLPVIGMLHNKSGNYTKAVQYLEQNYEVMKKIGMHFRPVLEMGFAPVLLSDEYATPSPHPKSQFRATPNAVQVERHFFGLSPSGSHAGTRTACSPTFVAGDKAEVERARILVGVARGNQFWTSGFLQMVDRDINSIMKWKCQGVMPDHGQ